MELAQLLLVALVVGASSLSRGWRWQAPPWGAAVLAAAAVSNQGDGLLLALMSLAAAVEVLGRRFMAWDALPPLLSLTAVALVLPPTTDPGTMLGHLTVLLGTAVVSPAAVHAVLPHHRRRPFDPWFAGAAALVLLAAAALIATGLREGDPALVATGCAVLLAMPLLIVRLRQHWRRSLRLQVLGEVAETFGATVAPEHGSDLETATRRLHEALVPALGHRLTVVALHPLVRLRGPTVAAHPLDPSELPGLQERLANLFARRRRSDRSGSRTVVPEQSRALHPDFPAQLLIPITRARQRLGVVGLLGDELRLHTNEVRELGRALNTLVRHLVDVVDLTERTQLLDQRAEKQRARLLTLLQLHRMVERAPDLASMCRTLVRAVAEGFQLPLCALLMRTSHGTWRIAAEIESTAAAELEVLGSALEAALALGRPLSHCRVISRENWPLPLPGGDLTPYLVALPLQPADELLAVVVGSPAPGASLPDLEELHLLELFVEQTAPMLLSALQLEEVQRQTLVDGLTGVANRRALDRAVELAVCRAQENGTRCSVAMVDVDDFKGVNDRYGHGVGDQVLAEIAELITQSVRARDVVARYGGEEFCIVLPEQDADRAAPVLERVRHAVESAGFARGELTRPVRLTVSIGYASYPCDGAGPKSLLERADLALYRAKRSGKNRLVCATELTDPGLIEEEEPFAF